MKKLVLFVGLYLGLTGATFAATATPKLAKKNRKYVPHATVQQVARHLTCTRNSTVSTLRI